MSKLEDAMLKHMQNIVDKENRPFSCIDFYNFVIDGVPYSAKHGTIRNTFSKFRREKKIEYCYRVKISFYTLPGHQFGIKKMMTEDHADITSILNHPIYKIIKNMPFGQRCIHDIHLTFTAKGLWQLLSQREEFKSRIHSKNKSISFGYFEIEHLNVRITTQKTNTVNIVVGCSQLPIQLESHGIIRLTEALTRAEERLAAVLNDSRNFTHNVEFNPNTIRIPNKDNWTITLWHIGRDSLQEYSGERFHCIWQVAKNLCLRIYSKEMKLQTRKDKGTIIRTEVQENPKMSIEYLTEFVKNSNENLPSKFFENKFWF